MTRHPLAPALLALALLAGPAAHAQEPASGPAPAPAAAESSTPAVQVQAPERLRLLLEKHLDIVRLGQLAGKEAGDISDTEWARLIAATPAQARALLQTEGHFRPEIAIDTLGTAPMRLRVRVEPGPQAVVKALQWRLAGELPQAQAANQTVALELAAELQVAWALPVGAAFRNEAWADAKAEVVKRARAGGYLAARLAESSADVDAERAQVALHITLDSGPLFRGGKVDVTGLKQQDAATVRHLSGFPPGTPLTERRLVDYQERLLRSGLYEQVSVSADPDPAQAAAATVRVRVTETALQQATFGLGYSDNTGLRATAEHVHRRVFGQALTARNKVQWGQENRAWSGELSTHPGQDMWRWLLGGTVERDEGVSDLVLAQRLRLGRTKDDQRIERFYYVEAERSVRTAPSSRHEALALSANYHAVWRSLDSLVLPTRGYVLTTQLAAGHSSSRTDASGAFTRLYGRLTGYWPVGPNWFGQARVELGQVSAGTGVWVPDAARFRAGGDDSVRGYAYRSLGPEVDGSVGSGNALFTTSVELGRPVGPAYPTLWGAVFVDSGGAAQSFKQLQPATGLGAGLRWRSPVGPLRLDLAWGTRTHKLRLHVSVGVAF